MVLIIKSHKEFAILKIIQNLQEEDMHSNKFQTCSKDKKDKGQTWTS